MADFSTLSDEELRNIAGTPAPNDFSRMSDEQLKAIAGPPQQPAVEDWYTRSRVTAPHQTQSPSVSVSMPSLSETWPARIAKGAYESIKSGVTLPGDVYSGQAKIPSSGAVPGSVPFGSPQSSGERVADLTILASPAPVAMRAGESAIPAARAVTTTRYEPQTILQGHGLPTTIDNVPVTSMRYEPVISRSPIEPKAPSRETLRDTGDRLYDAARNSGVEVNPRVLSDWASGLRSRLDEQGLIKAFSKKTAAALGMLADPPIGSTATYGNLISFRRALNEASQNFKKPSEQKAAVEAIHEFDAFLKQLETNAPPNTVIGDIASANGNWAAAGRSKTVSGKAKSADFRSAINNEDIAQRLRSKMGDIVERPKEASGFSAEELAQAEGIGRGTGGMNVARGIADRLSGGSSSAIAGGLGATIGGLLSGSATLGNGMGLGAGAGFTAGVGAKELARVLARGTENKLTRQAVDRLDEAVRTRSPLHEFNTANPEMIVAKDIERRLALAKALAVSKAHQEEDQ